VELATWHCLAALGPMRSLVSQVRSLLVSFPRSPIFKFTMPWSKWVSLFIQTVCLSQRVTPFRCVYEYEESAFYANGKPSGYNDIDGMVSMYVARDSSVFTFVIVCTHQHCNLGEVIGGAPLLFAQADRCESARCKLKNSFAAAAAKRWGTQMSNVANHAADFYKQVAVTGALWTLRDSGGFPAPANQEGRRAQPFWSSLSRVSLIIQNTLAYKGFEPVEISWQAFKEKWAPGLTKDGVLVGVNWSGINARGYDLAPSQVVANVEALLSVAS
jgi:hypothetical protein